MSKAIIKPGEVEALLRGYDNYQKARRVWNSYESDAIRYGCYGSAKNILRVCKNSEDLDLKLDILITEAERALTGHVRVGPVDIDSDGSYGNAINILEGD